MWVIRGEHDLVGAYSLYRQWNGVVAGIASDKTLPIEIFAGFHG